jgi:uncharacterized protein YwgA
MRNATDKVVDSVLLTYLMQQCAPIFGRTKIQKSMFLVELGLKKAELVGPHFRFMRYHNGPFSRQVWDSFDDLVSSGFLHKTTFDLTERGKFLLELVIPEIRRLNPNILSVVDHELSSCKQRTGEDLMRYIYGLQVTPDEEPSRQMRIEDIPLGWTIIDPPSGGLNVPADLEALMRDELSRSQRDIEEARRNYPQTEHLAIADLKRALNAFERS